jgi:hypothetical protein
MNWFDEGLDERSTRFAHEVRFLTGLSTRFGSPEV